MSDLVRTVVSDYLFVEAAKVVQAIEVQAGLKQIPEAAVSSFYLGTSGIDNLVRKKYETLNDLADNRVKIKRFICHPSCPRSRLFVLIASSQVRTLNEQISTVKEQIERGVRLAQYEQQALFVVTPVKELSDDELPF